MLRRLLRVKAKTLQEHRRKRGSAGRRQVASCMAQPVSRCRRAMAFRRHRLPFLRAGWFAGSGRYCPWVFRGRWVWRQSSYAFDLRGAGAPRSRPSVLKSSSISGQWMPYPAPHVCQFARCSGVAWNSRGYQSKGTVIVRPSMRSTLNASSVKWTSLTHKALDDECGSRKI